LEELQRLAKLKAPLVKLRGQWVQINPEEIKAAIEFWKKKFKSRPLSGKSCGWHSEEEKFLDMFLQGHGYGMDADLRRWMDELPSANCSTAGLRTQVLSSTWLLWLGFSGSVVWAYASQMIWG
jgi:hypothetical protein